MRKYEGICDKFGSARVITVTTTLPLCTNFFIASLIADMNAKLALATLITSFISASAGEKLAARKHESLNKSLTKKEIPIKEGGKVVKRSQAAIYATSVLLGFALNAAVAHHFSEEDIGISEHPTIEILQP